MQDSNQSGSAQPGLFVGRQAELRRFREILRSPAGQAVLVVGQAGMGKTMLVNRLAELARADADLKCGVVRYEVTPTDPVDSTLALILDHAFEAGQIEEGSFSGTKRRLEQWRAFLNVLRLGDLVLSLRRDPLRNTRDQFLERLGRVSEKMPEDGRAVFVIDSEKYMHPQSDQAWAIVIRDLPPKIKLVFAQRPEDVLAASPHIARCTNVVRIPESDLSVLDAESVEEMLRLRARRVAQPLSQLRAAVAGYEGHPHAVAAALDLIEAGVPIEELPRDPTGISERQWGEVCRHSPEAIKLFKAHAILEVAVPDEVVDAVGDLEGDQHRNLLAHRYLRGLLREEVAGRRVYHALLADHVLGQLSLAEAEPYHRRAIDIYRKRLTAEHKPDAVAAVRLGEHVVAADGEDAFVSVFLNECYPALRTLGLLDAALHGLRRCLKMVSGGSADEAAVVGNLGLIYRVRGDLEEAERMHRKSLEIEEGLGHLEGMASQYGNLGLIYETRGNLEEAEAMLRKSLEIHKGVGHLEGMASDYGNLGLIYQRRRNLEDAEAMLRKSLEIHERLGYLEGMASNYGNLGLIYRARGDLEEAEATHQKSLEIAERLGHLEGMASQYGNLGLICQARGDLEEAELMYRKSLEIDERLGHLKGMASDYGNLGAIYQTRGGLKEAERMYRKSLELHERLGHLEGMASDYGNLGFIYKTRGDLEEARELWVKGRAIYAQMAMPHMVAKMDKWIGGLDDQA